MKEAVMKVIYALTQEDFHGAFQKLLLRYNKCIAAGGDYLEGDWSFMCVLSIKVPIQKKSGNLSYAPHILPHIHLCGYLSIYQNKSMHNSNKYAQIYFHTHIYICYINTVFLKVDRCFCVQVHRFMLHIHTFQFEHIFCICDQINLPVFCLCQLVYFLSHTHVRKNMPKIISSEIQWLNIHTHIHTH